MNYIVIFNDLEGSDKRYELESIHSSDNPKGFFKTAKISCFVTEEEKAKILKAIDNGFIIYFNTLTKSFAVKEKPFMCSVWTGKGFKTSPIGAKNELKKLIEFRNSDKETLTNKVIKINFYLTNFEILENKAGKILVYGKYFQKEELQEYYKYMLSDLKDLTKRIEDVKDYIDKTDVNILLTKKKEIIKNLILSSIKSDFELGELSKEDVIILYSKFIENMRNLPFEIKFIPVEKIRTSSYFLDEENNTYENAAEKNNNMYMKNNSHTNLAMDIYNNGTYWPLFVTIESDLDYKIIEGNYRLGTIKAAVEKGEINKNFKMLAVTNKLRNNFEEVTFDIPFVENVEYMKNHTYYKFLYRCPNIERTECGKFFRVTFTRDYISSYGSSFAANCINMYGIGLNNYVFKYKLKPED
ncbi:MAG: hypothetical protein ACRC5T_13130, partial [Cetobacterium sp.]